VNTLGQTLSVVVAIPPPIELHGALVCSTVALILVQTLACELPSNIDTPTLPIPGSPREQRPASPAAAGRLSMISILPSEN
jgi:hypothetical protein